MEELNSSENLALATKSYALMKSALDQENLTESKETIFDDILVSAKLPSSLFQPGGGNGQDNRAIVGKSLLVELKGMHYTL